MNNINKNTDAKPMPDLIRNIDVDKSEDDDNKNYFIKEKLIPTAPDEKELNTTNIPNNGEPWKSSELGELVDNKNEMTAKDKKRRNQRKVKKALGWTCWILCPPVALCVNCMREEPTDPSDEHDWNDDPLRPWAYKIDMKR